MIIGKILNNPEFFGLRSRKGINFLIDRDDKLQTRMGKSHQIYVYGQDALFRLLSIEMTSYSSVHIICDESFNIKSETIRYIPVNKALRMFAECAEVTYTGDYAPHIACRIAYGAKRPIKRFSGIIVGELLLLCKDVVEDTSNEPDVYSYGSIISRSRLRNHLFRIQDIP